MGRIPGQRKPRFRLGRRVFDVVEKRELVKRYLNKEVEIEELSVSGLFKQKEILALIRQRKPET